MPKRRNYTRELLTARERGQEAYEAGTGPRMRIMTDWGAESYPVAYEPRTKRDPQPWVMYNARTGEEYHRATGRMCWAEPVTDENEVIPTQTVMRSVLLRLAASGVAMRQESDRANSWIEYRFADGSEFAVSGDDVYGDDVTSLHPIGEHGGFTWQWTSADHRRDRVGVIPPGEEGANYGRDSAALVALVLEHAERHGRMRQSYTRDDLLALAAEWEEVTGRTVLPYDSREHAHATDRVAAVDIESAPVDPADAEEAARLVDLAESLHVDASELDGPVHDAAARYASEACNRTGAADGDAEEIHDEAARQAATDINNGGVARQVPYLVAQYGARRAEQIIRDAV